MSRSYESWEKIGDVRKRLLKKADTLIERVQTHMLKDLEVTVTDENLLKTIEVCQERYW